MLTIRVTIPGNILRLCQYSWHNPTPAHFGQDPKSVAGARPREPWPIHAASLCDKFAILAQGTNQHSLVSTFHVAVTSRWFPPVFAFLQMVRHLAMIAYTYWVVAQNESRFDVAGFIRKDLARPLFEPYGFCGAWTHYASGQSAVLGLDLPAYMAATLLHSVMTWQTSCVDALTTPRGHILSATFVFLLWFLVGLSIRRFAQRRWHRCVEGRIKRFLVALGLIPLPFGLLGLLFSVIGLFVSDIGLSLRLAGIAFWTLYVAALAAERLRVWPFDRMESPAQPALAIEKPT